MMKLFFAGSFNPFTLGHANIVDRALALDAQVVIAVGFNISKTDSSDIARRVSQIQAVYANRPDVSVVSFSGLTVDAARQHGCTALLRGVRSVTDFEYERNLADVNRQISGLETILLFAEPQYAAVSSSMVRELEHFGHDVSKFLP